MIKIDIDKVNYSFEVKGYDIILNLNGIEVDIKFNVPYDLIEGLHDTLKELDDEKTYDELSDEILDLNVEIENLKEEIDFKNEHIDRITGNNLF